VYYSPIGNFVIGQTQLGNEVSGTDKIWRWSNPGKGEILRGKLPASIGHRAARRQLHAGNQSRDYDGAILVRAPSQRYSQRCRLAGDGAG